MPVKRVAFSKMRSVRQRRLMPLWRHLDREADPNDPTLQTWTRTLFVPYPLPPEAGAIAAYDAACASPTTPIGLQRL